MSWRNFFDVFGLPIQDWNDVWPNDEQDIERERRARLLNQFQKIYAAMLRRRQAIESLKLQIEKVGDQDMEDSRRRIQRHEARYQILLGKMKRIKAAKQESPSSNA
jgi:hypothetical protein